MFFYLNLLSSEGHCRELPLGAYQTLDDKVFPRMVTADDGQPSLLEDVYVPPESQQWWRVGIDSPAANVWLTVCHQAGDRVHITPGPVFTLGTDTYVVAAAEEREPTPQAVYVPERCVLFLYQTGSILRTRDDWPAMLLRITNPTIEGIEVTVRGGLAEGSWQNYGQRWLPGTPPELLAESLQPPEPEPTETVPEETPLAEAPAEPPAPERVDTRLYLPDKACHEDNELVRIEVPGGTQVPWVLTTDATDRVWAHCRGLTGVLDMTTGADAYLSTKKDNGEALFTWVGGQPRGRVLILTAKNEGKRTQYLKCWAGLTNHSLEQHTGGEIYPPFVADENCTNPAP